MSTNSKHTHTAVHAIGYVDNNKNPAEIKAGSTFNPTDANLDAKAVKNLEDRGAIRKLTRDEREVESEVSEAEKSAAAAGNKLTK